MYADTVTVLQLPWVSGKDDKWFKRIVIIFLLFFLGVAMPVSLVTLPELTRAEKEQLPPQLARFVLTQQQVTPPKIIEPPKVEEPKKQEMKQEKMPEVKEITTTTIAKTTIKTDDRKPDSTDVTNRARDTAKQSGLLAMADEMNELTNTNNIDASIRAKVNQNNTNTEAARYDASIVTSTASAITNKVDDNKITGSINKTELQEREAGQQTTAATGRHEAEKSDLANGLSQGKAGGRAPEDITIVFNKNKSGLYSLYDRERRKNTGLKGRIVFQLTISPSGKVTDVKIISSELNNPSLEARIISRIKMFMFTPTSGESVIITYPVEFLP